MNTMVLLVFLYVPLKLVYPICQLLSVASEQFGLHVTPLMYNKHMSVILLRCPQASEDSSEGPPVPVQKMNGSIYVESLVPENKGLNTCKKQKQKC